MAARQRTSGMADCASAGAAGAAEADLVEVYETERHLLYVACTRARDSLWVSGVTPESEFLRDVLE
jgi:ATP-dependent exoDNAse (exonuclease V) beta subunit